jgi:replicative DNA helicase
MEQSHLPPQDLSAERSVLSCLLQVTGSFETIMDSFTIEAFYDNQHQIIASAVQQLIEARISPDVVTVTQQLIRTKQLQNIHGGAGRIAEITNAPYYNIEQYYKIVFDKYLLRKSIEFASKTIAYAYEGSMDGAQVLGTLKDGIDGLEKNMHTSKTKTTREMVGNALQNIANAESNNGVLGPKTGLRDLDKILRGLRPTNIYVIAARVAMGKTSYVVCLAKSLCLDQNIPIALFSLEMEGEQLIHRLLSDLSEIDNNHLASGKLTPFEKQKLDIAQKRITDNFHIDDTPAITIQYFESKVRKLVQQGVQYVIIDYLGLMDLNEKDKKGKNREQEIAFLTKNLKRIAKKYKIGILELVQVGRSAEEREGCVPMLSDLKESGSIEENADVVMFLYRAEYYNIEFSKTSGKPTKGKAEIIVAKHRGGPVDSVMVKWRGELTRFEDLDEDVPDTIESTIFNTNEESTVHF